QSKKSSVSWEFKAHPSRVAERGQREYPSWPFPRGERGRLASDRKIHPNAARPQVLPESIRRSHLAATQAVHVLPPRPFRANASFCTSSAINFSDQARGQR